MPEAIWEKADLIRDVVLDTMAEIGAADANFVMTNVLFNTPAGRKLFEKVRDTAKRRNAVFLPVELKCDESIMLERVSNPEREKKLKLTERKILHHTLSEYETLPFTHENLITIDTGKHSPSESVSLILEHIENLERP